MNNPNNDRNISYRTASIANHHGRLLFLQAINQSNKREQQVSAPSEKGQTIDVLGMRNEHLNDLRNREKRCGHAGRGVERLDYSCRF